MRAERDRACPNIIAHPFRTGAAGPPSTDPLASASDVADLAARFLILVADPRDARGLRYPALALLCAAVSAVLTGAPLPHRDQQSVDHAMPRSRC
ncbi:hypothetical protein ACRAWF_27425 [Streptomyces sp. L7]